MNSKNSLLFLLFLCFQVTCFANGTGKMVIRGKECKYDTLAHRTIAPGSTWTHFQFNDITLDDVKYTMSVHLITIDLNNKYNSLSPYMANDEYMTKNEQKEEIARQKKLGLKPVASINGGPFSLYKQNQSTTEANEISGSLITNGEIKYGNYNTRPNFYLDSNKTAHLGYTKLKGTISANGKTFTIGQVNHMRDIVDDKGLLTLFCNGMGHSRSMDSNTGTDVKVKLQNCTNIVAGKDIQCEVLSTYNNSGNTFNDGEAILSGIDSAADFLKTLNPNDIVTIKMNNVDSNNNIIDALQQRTGFSFYIKDGVLDDHSETNAARSSIGMSQDGKTAYMAVLEYNSSSNAPTICFLDLLKNVGVYNALHNDGGPSSEITVDGEYVTKNQISSGDGRLITDGFILYSTAPTDNKITHVELDNTSSRTMYKGETITLNMYGYNQYGEMILSNAQTDPSVKITCTEGLGTIEDGNFTAQEYGEGYIYVKLDGSDETITIPVSVIEKHTLVANTHKIFTGEGRECQINLTYYNDDSPVSVDPSQATWTKTGTYVISSCKNGLVVPYADGEDKVIATYNGVSDTILVVVENLKESTYRLDLTNEISDYSTSDIHLQSVPHYFEAVISGTPGSTVTIKYSLGYDGKTETKTATIQDDGLVTINVPLDYDDIDTYPVNVSKQITCDTGTATLTNIYALYYLMGDPNGDGSIDIADYTTIANHILGNDGKVFIDEAANINHDNTIDVGDLTSEANLILYGSSSTAKVQQAKAKVSAKAKEAKAATDPSAYENIIYIPESSVNVGETTDLSVCMKNSVAMTGFQFDIVMPEGLTIESETDDEDVYYSIGLSTSRTTAKKTDTFSSALQADGSVRVLCGSTKSKTFSGNDGEVATITIIADKDIKGGDYTITLKNIAMSDADGKSYKVELADYTVKVIDPTGIEDVTVDSGLKDGKYIINNRLIIKSGNRYYNAHGELLK